MDTAIARPELLLVADAVAREKNIDREEVLEAMEQAIQKAGRAKYGHEKDIRATIDRKSGDVRLSRWTEIVDTVENEETQMGKVDAAKLFPDKAVGDFVVDPLPPIDFGRIAAQTAKQVIVQRSANTNASASMTSSRTASERSSTASSSARSTAT